MRKTYLNNDEVYNIIDIKDSYFEKPSEESSHSFYELLPMEYDVFSELNVQSLHFQTSQKEFLDAILGDLRTKLKELFVYYGAVKMLPKLNISNDIDNAIIINWIYSNYRIYVNIERKIEDSFYGIVIQDQEQNIRSNSGKMDYANYKKIIDQILYFLFNQV